jgi:hypothetical protein
VASVHDFSEEISQIFPRDPVVGLQVVEEDIGADDQVASVEWVDLVPTLK